MNSNPQTSDKQPRLSALPLRIDFRSLRDNPLHIHIEKAAEKPQRRICNTKTIARLPLCLTQKSTTSTLALFRVTMPPPSIGRG
jgi:hypothetical protein